MSWGLMQVMGAVAREYGFSGRFLSQLCDPAVGLEYGCRHLSILLKRHGTIRAALSAYNSGQPHTMRGNEYAEKVTAIWPGNQPTET